MRYIVSATIATLSSLLLLVAVIFWARSHWRYDTVYWQDNVRAFTVHSDDGEILYWQGRYTKSWPLGFGVRSYPLEQTGGDILTLMGHPRLGFRFIFSNRVDRRAMVLVPDWLVVIALSIAPSVCIIQFAMRRRRRTGGLCHCCGYDLRATPDKCPECGAVPINQIKNSN